MDDLLERSLTEMDWLLQLNGTGSEDDDIETIRGIGGLEGVQQLRHVDNGMFGYRSKPPFSYTQLIKSAISSSPKKRMSLSEIYDWIKDNHPYYKTASHGWKVLYILFFLLT